MIRSTVAHVDLAALQSNFRAIQQYLAADVGAGRPVPGRQPPGIIAVVIFRQQFHPLC